jgi:hypothetical protein
MSKEMGMSNSIPGDDLPTMPDPSRDNPQGGPHLPTMPDPVHDPDKGQQLPTDPDPSTGAPPRIDDPPPDDAEGDPREIHKRIA